MSAEYENYIAAQTQTNFHTAEFSLNVGPIRDDALPVSSETEPNILKSRDGKYEIVYSRESKPPKKIRHYLMGRVIGEGNFGKVREAINTITQERVAIKIFNLKRLKKMRTGVSNVRREIAIMKRLCHPNVARFIEMFEIEEKGKMYIVMDLIGGGSLRTLLDSSPNNRLSESHCRWYFKQLIEGLEYCHSVGIVHRDIKPSNLMITTDGILKIADFGVAEDLSEAGHDLIDASYTSGTPSFLSPEVASGLDGCVSGTKVDIWAVGVTLYALAVGEVPFKGGSIFALLQNISKAEYEIPERTSKDLADLLSRLLEPVDANRIAIPEIKEHPWFLAPLDRAQTPETSEQGVSSSHPAALDAEGKTEKDSSWSCIIV